MSIDYARMRGLTARKLIAALKRDGFVLDRQVGSHQLYRHPDRRRVTIASHSLGEVFRPKILKIIVELQARWTEEDLRRLKLVS